MSMMFAVLSSCNAAEKHISGNHIMDVLQLSDVKKYGR